MAVAAAGPVAWRGAAARRRAGQVRHRRARL